MYFLNTKDRFSLTSSTAPMENYPVWDSGTTYNTGDTVIYNNKICESVVDSNTSTPGEDANWADRGAINPYKCIDEYINTQTSSTEDIVIEFTINKVNGIGLINVIASSVEIEVYDSGDVLILKKEESAITGISSWKDYFFSDLEYKNKFFTELPYIFKGKIKLTVKKAETAAVGVVLIGFMQDLGLTLMDIRAGIDDYSKKVVDDNTGNIYLQQGNYRDTVDCKVLLKKTDFNTVKQRLVEVRATPVLWLADTTEDYRELFLYGLNRYI